MAHINFMSVSSGEQQRNSSTPLSRRFSFPYNDRNPSIWHPSQRNWWRPDKPHQDELSFLSLGMRTGEKVIAIYTEVLKSVLLIGEASLQGWKGQARLRESRRKGGRP